MKIKRFFAKDMRSALEQVKQALGADAVIMSNKKVTGGVEVVAAIDAAPSGEVAPAPTSRAVTDELGEDRVSLGMHKRPPLQALRRPERPKTEAKIHRPGQAKADAIAHSLDALLQRQGKPRVESPVGATAERPLNFSRPARGADEPRRPLGARPAPLRREGNDEFAEMKREMAALRKLLEHQVSGLMWQEMERREPVRAMLIAQLKKLGFADELADQLACYIPEHLEKDAAWQQTLELVGEQLVMGQDEIIRHGGVVALIGPTGVGKTTTIAKLAARFALEHGADQVALVTTDTYRIGAHEQLSTFGRIMGCPVKVASDADELNRILHQLRNRKLVLIDTAGMSQRDVRLNEQLDTLMRNTEMPVKNYLVLSATSQRRVLQEAIEHFRRIPLAGAIFTKLDECLSLGEILGVAIQNALPISYLTDGQRVPEDLMVADANFLVEQAAALLESSENDNYPYALDDVSHNNAVTGHYD